jgi:hypothetical protein
MKLHIPAPDHEQEHEGFPVLDTALLLSAIVAIGLFFAFRVEKGVQYEDVASNLDPAEVEVMERLSGELKTQKLLAEKIDLMPVSERKTRPWTDEEAIATLQFGSRVSNELLCGARRSQISENTVADAMLLELVKAIDRRGENAPYGCLSGLFFEAKLPQDSLRQELEEFWAEAEQWGGNARLAGTVADFFRETRERPESPRFYRWLRVCGVNTDYEAMPACQQLLYQISPAQGADLILVIDKHLEEVGTDVRPSEMVVFTHTLGVIARNGQPKNFRVTQTPALPDYDQDIRHAALFQLCRFVNSPEDNVSESAAAELSTTAKYSARAMGKTMRLRWYEACRTAFKSTDDQPLLAVWNGDPESAPKYTLSAIVDSGYCELKEGYPAWYCGSSRWNSKDTGTDLQNIFVNTSWVEWQ